MMQIKLIFTTKVSHLASFWKWDVLELGNGLLNSLQDMRCIMYDIEKPAFSKISTRDTVFEKVHFGT